MKLCIDCKHHKPSDTGAGEYSKCEHPAVMEAATKPPCVVTGKVVIEPTYCTTARRAGGGTCEYEGRLFEAREAA